MHVYNLFSSNPYKSIRVVNLSKRIKFEKIPTPRGNIDAHVSNIGRLI